MIEPMLISLGVLFGQHHENLRLLVALILMFPLAAVFRCLPARTSPIVYHIFSIITCMWLFAGVNHLWGGFAFLTCEMLMVYGLIWCAHDKDWMPQVVLLLVLLLQSATSIRNMVWVGAGEDYAYDHAAAQMMLTIKLSSLAYNIHDGVILTREKKNESRDPASLSLSPYQREHSVEKLPALAEYLGYAFFFPTFLVGPTCEFIEYRNFIRSLTGPRVKSKDQPTQAMSPFKPAMERLFTALAFSVLFAIAIPIFDEHWMLTPEFAALPFILRYIYMLASLLTARCKYYAVWIMAEGACVLCGIGYNGRDPDTGRHRWDRMVNVRVRDIELAQSMRSFLDAWNVCTNRWLRHYVYVRQIGRGERPGLKVTVITFVVSAFWHGFYPGYYVTFIYTAFAVHAARVLRRYLRPVRLHFEPKYPIIARAYDVLGWVLTISAIDFAAVSFRLLDWTPTVMALRNLSWFGVWGLVAVEAFFALGGASILPRLDTTHGERR